MKLAPRWEHVIEENGAYLTFFALNRIVVKISQDLILLSKFKKTVSRYGIQSYGYR